MRKYLLVLLFLTITSSYLPAQTLYSLTEGINPTVGKVSSVSKLREHLYFFSGYNSTTGKEPYITDGTQFGTHLLQDINSGTESSDTYSFYRINDTVCIFPANDGSTNHGTELWRSNGTSSGTYMVADLSLGSSSTILNISRVQLNGKNFFTAWYDSGIVLYITDGSAIGTIPLLTGVPGNPSNVTFITSGNGIMYFYVWLNTDLHLWRTDGTANGTFELIDTHSYSSVPRGAFLGNSFIFCSSDSLHGEELWITDGTIVGTTLLKDIMPGTGSASPRDFTSVNGKLLFQADDTNLARTLWATDGTDTGTYQLGDSTLISPYGYKMYNTSGSDVYISQTDDIMWKSDGTIGGTSLVHTFSCSNCHFNSGSANPVVEEFGLKFFVLLEQAWNGYFGSIWATDGTDSGTFEVYAHTVMSNYPIDQLTEACGEIFCRVNMGSYGEDYHLWKVEQDTAYDLNILPDFGINYLRIYFVDDGAIFFTSFDSMWSSQLYRLQVCPSAAVQNIFITNSFTLYPNPGDGLFNIQLPDDLTSAEVRVNDMMGKGVYSNKAEFSPDGKLSLHLKNIPAGVYLLQVISEGRLRQQIFIKQ